MDNAGSDLRGLQTSLELDAPEMSTLQIHILFCTRPPKPARALATLFRSLAPAMPYAAMYMGHLPASASNTPENGKTAPCTSSAGATPASTAKDILSKIYANMKIYQKGRALATLHANVLQFQDVKLNFFKKCRCGAVSACKAKACNIAIFM